jgi:predicted naringenin-chalcone synthase
LKTIYAKSGIHYRHSVLAEFGTEDKPEHIIWHPAGKQAATQVAKRMEVYEEYALGLCAEAVQSCLDQLEDIKAADITHVITFSCTGMYAPGLDIELVERFSIPRSAERTCINFMGCYAAVNALKSAYHIARSDENAVVLIAGVELCSLHYQKSNEAAQMVANALFADGAAAAIVSARDLQKGSQPALCLESFYAEFEPSAANDMIWRIGDAGFHLRLTPEVPEVVNDNISQLVDSALDRVGLDPSDIDYYAIHPGGVKILEACEHALGISKEDNATSYGVLRDYGNMSSVTILFVLQGLLQKLHPSEKGKHILACAFGPGITMESMILSTC